MKVKQVIVVGLGRFGSSIAETLEDNGCEVLAMDIDPERLEEIAPKVTHAVCADATDVDTLTELGAGNFDMAVITIGSDIKASSVATMLMKEQGVARVIAKAHDEQHGRLLMKVGADKIVFPERDMGRRMAHNLISGNVLEFIQLSKDYTLSEIAPLKKWIGKTLMELKLRQEYKINVIAIRTGEKFNAVPDAHDVIREDDALVVLGPAASIRELEKRA